MKRSGLAQIPLMIGLLLMAVAVPVATKLVQTNQENRGQAAGSICSLNNPCPTGQKCSSGFCVVIPTVAPSTKPTAKPTARPTQANCVDTLWLDTSDCTKDCGGGTKTQRSNCTRTRTIACNTKACPTTAPSYECSLGEKKCVGSSAYSCKSNRMGWDITPCSYGCKSGSCIAAPTATPKPAIGCLGNAYKCIDNYSVACLNGTFSGAKIYCSTAGCDTSTGKCKVGLTPTKVVPTPTPVTSGGTCASRGGRCLSGTSFATVTCGGGSIVQTSDCSTFNYQGSTAGGCCITNLTPTPKPNKCCCLNDGSGCHISTSCGWSYWDVAMSNCSSLPTPTPKPNKCCCLNDGSGCHISTSCGWSYWDVAMSNCSSLPTPTKVVPKPTIPTLAKCPAGSITAMNSTICGIQQELVARIAGGVCCKNLVPTLTPTKGPTCIANGSCKPEGGSCCSGYSAYSTTCVDKQKCGVKPAGCIANGSCKPEGGSCCSGYSAYSTTCVDKQKCAVAPTLTPTKPPITPPTSCNCIAGKWTGSLCTSETVGKPCGIVTPPATCDPAKYKGEKSGDIWLHFDDAYTAKCICGGTDYHYVCANKFWACGDGSKNTNCPSCIAECPDRNDVSLLLSCTPSDSDGTTLAIKCSREGLKASCGGKTYCCPSAGGAWTTDLTKCMQNNTCTQCSGKPDAKGKGDADCSGVTNINDASIWRSEFIEGELGEITKNSWHADFDCNGKVNLNDISIWRDNFIKGL